MANVRPPLVDEQPTNHTAAAIGGGNMAVNHTPPYSEDLPCEKYRQFMDSSVQERTFMIEKLVDTFANVIDSIWHPKFLIEHQQVKVMPTRGFCNEILKRSKATYSTLQISLFYIFRVKKVVHEKLYQRIQQSKQQQQLNADMQTGIVTNQMDDLMCCGRRMFLASLMVASKYLHDKNYHNKAWAKITGLDIKEINAAEMAFLNLIDYRLYVSKPTFDRWYTQIHGHIQKSYKSTPLNKPPTMMTGKDNANILPSPHSRLSQTTQRIIHNSTDYPSPPPDENTNHPLAPMSPSITTDKCTSFQRTDSGVSFDVFSPHPKSTTTTTTYSIINSTTPSIGAKRQWTSEEQDSTKRLCQ
ncbi:unnamed protein product [Mucor hiemalis]